VCAYPNAGLPNAFGQYDESPEAMARQIGDFAADGIVNIVGDAAAQPRTTSAPLRRRSRSQAADRADDRPADAALGPSVALASEIPFVNVGERTNVTGSAKFRKLVTAGDYAGALVVARDQVANGRRSSTSIWTRGSSTRRP
jgi:5-methyltetrahydrofolate--homocysteine methyltransferase